MRRLFCAFGLSLALLLGAAGVRASNASADSGYTQLILHVNATTTVTLSILTHAGACTMVNSGTNAAAIDLGSANKTTRTFGCPGTGPTYTSGNTYKLATSLDFQATCSGTCNRWKLSANLPAAAGTGLTWKLGGKTLNAVAQTITNNITYATTQNEAFELDVKTNGAGAAALGAVQETIDFTASDTTTTTATASATLNAEEINEPGISIFFTQDASGVAMTGGAFDAAVDLGSVSAYGTLSTGVTRTGVNSVDYTVQTPFDITVELGATPTSVNYTLQADATSVPTGFTYLIDSIALTGSLQTITSTGTYGSAQQHTLGIKILTVGPTVNTPQNGSLTFLATAN